MSDSGGKSERIKQIKEALRKKHEVETELRLKAHEDPEPFNRFSKYRRSSGSEKHVSRMMKRVEAVIPKDQGIEDCGSFIVTEKKPCNYEYESSRVSCLERRPSKVQDLTSSFEDSIDNVHDRKPSITKKVVHKKPNIPLILKQGGEDLTDEKNNGSVRKKKPSILKKKDENHSSGGASVSFDLELTPMTRTKSTESNLSCDTETGYWSGGENMAGGILKSRLRDLQQTVDNGDQKSILKDRRLSLGSNSSSGEGSLQGILKRKLSYDSSYLLDKGSSHSINFLVRSTEFECLSPEPKPILKKKSSSEDLEEMDSTQPKPILKKKRNPRGDQSRSSSSDGLDEGPIRPILKKSLRMDEKWEIEGNLYKGRSILKRLGDKGSRNYCSFEDSIAFDPDDRSEYSGMRHGSLPNADYASSDLVGLKSKMNRNVVTRSESEEDLIMSLSVAEKRSIFLQMEREKNGSARRDKRNATQPVTLDEIEKASLLVHNQISSIPIDQLKSSIMKDERKELLGSMLGELSERNIVSEAQALETKPGQMSRSLSLGGASSPPIKVPQFSSSPPPPPPEEKEALTLPNEKLDIEIEDPSKLSLRERVRMFNSLSLTPPPSYVRLVKRSVTSKRFQTQPVTTLEHRRIQDCLSHIGSEPSGGDSEGFEGSADGDEGEVDCGRVDSEALEGSDMREKLTFPGTDSSNDDEEPAKNHHHGPMAFIKRRVKSSSYEIAGMEDTSMIAETKSVSIADKIAALKTNGEMSWKKRICKPIIKKVLVDEVDNHRNIEISANNKDSPSVVANRLSLLEKSQDGWRQRVSENDATLFTVQSKLEKAGKLKESPQVPVEKKSKGGSILTPMKFISKNSKSLGAEAVKAALNLNLQKKVLTPQVSPTHKVVPADEVMDDRIIRSVAPNDNETFENFFTFSSSLIGSTAGPGPIGEVSLDELRMTDRQYLGMRKNVKVIRTHDGVRNPIKSLASRLPEQSYSEIKPEIREQELKKRIHVENLSKTSHLSIEALAGLVSKEDFTAVKLKRAQSDVQKEFPYPMLIRVKGKRFVQLRLVPPQVSSLSSGDCFILVTKDKIYQFIGEFSNRMEKCKLADTANHIVQKRDLGSCLTSLDEVVTIEEPLINDRNDVKTFLNVLGGGIRTVEDETLGDEGDEDYEGGVIRTNRVFEVDSGKDALIPLLNEGGWGTQPKYAMLREDRVLVFDFGSEMYVWSGCRADSNLKRTGNRLAREMFEDSYNFSEVGHEFSPLGSVVSGDKRPIWCWLKKITHHMEPILFVEKFFDWPDESGKLIRVKNTGDGSGKDAGFNFSPCDVDEMLLAVRDIQEPILELEGFNVSRGSEIHDLMEKRYYIITTLDVQSWRISEFSKTTIEQEGMGHFYSTETYVVRWHYSVMQVGRDLKGNQSKHGGILGRARTAYFFWHGKDSKATEQGTSALMTVELDQEKGPQIRVVQGREPPAFLSLFKGLMFIHLGSPEECKQRSRRLYVTLGCADAEGHFIEVPMDPASFRSRGSFIFLDKLKSTISLWHGSHSAPLNQTIAQKGAKYISNSPVEFGLPKSLRLSEMKEGTEKREFFNEIGLKTEKEWKLAYAPLPPAEAGSLNTTSQITVFHFRSLNGILEAKLVLSPKRKSNVLQSFPVLQEDLYNVPQPGLFLVSLGRDSWLWHGWRPRGDEENENTATGSGEYRWGAERKGALETGLEYIKRSKGSGVLVHAGLEPPLFRALFPYWSTHEEAREMNQEDGKSECSLLHFAAALETFLKTTYTLDELQERPEGVDPLKLENYLSDDEFENLLKMSREEFTKLQQWRKDELKKQVGLF